MTRLVFGATGYLAPVLLARLGPSGTTVVTRTPTARAEQCLLLGPEPDYEVDREALRAHARRAQELWILSCPDTPDLDAQRRFHTLLADALLWAAESIDARRIVLFSSTMVHDGAGVKPWGHVEYFKLQLELLLDFVATAMRPDMEIRIVRLPALLRRDAPEQEARGQLLEDLLDAYRHGEIWPDALPERPGTSWCCVHDLCDALVDAPLRPGLHVDDAASGEIRFASLHRILRVTAPDDAQPVIPIFATEHFHTDTLGLPPRSLAAHLEAAGRLAVDR